MRGILNVSDGDCLHFNVDVVTRDDHLSANRADLDLDVDDTKRFRADIDQNETGINRLVELSKARDQTNGPCLAEMRTFITENLKLRLTLLDVTERVRARATRECTEEPYE
jgi:hypothetical protein